MRSRKARPTGWISKSSVGSPASRRSRRAKGSETSAGSIGSGFGYWRKLKGFALVRDWETGETYRAEIHWYEAAGIGRKGFKINGEARIQLRGAPARVLGDQIRSIDKSRLRSKIGVLSQDELLDVELAVSITLALRPS